MIIISRKSSILHLQAGRKERYELTIGNIHVFHGDIFHVKVIHSEGREDAGLTF